MPIVDRTYTDEQIIVCLAGLIVRHLKGWNLHITTVESCTGGALIHEITNVVGASDVTKGAFVTYSNEEKIALGVPSEIIEKYTVYSLETALAMANAGLEKSVCADVSVGITGSISRVDPKNSNSIPGIVYLGIKSWGGSWVTREIECPKKIVERSAIKKHIVKEALLALCLFFNLDIEGELNKYHPE